MKLARYMIYFLIFALLLYSYWPSKKEKKVSNCLKTEGKSWEGKFCKKIRVSKICESSAKPGEQIMFYGSSLGKVHMVGIGGSDADFKVIDDKRLQVQVPANSRSGEIEIFTGACSIKFPRYIINRDPDPIVAKQKRPANVTRKKQFLKCPNLGHFEKGLIAVDFSPSVARTEATEIAASEQGILTWHLQYFNSYGVFFKDLETCEDHFDKKKKLKQHPKIKGASLNHLNM